MIVFIPLLLGFGFLAMSLLPALLMWLASFARKEGRLPATPLVQASVCASIPALLAFGVYVQRESLFFVLTPWLGCALCALFLYLLVGLSRIDCLLLASVGFAPFAGLALWIWFFSWRGGL